MGNKKIRPKKDWVGSLLTLGSWSVLNAILCYLCYLIYGKGISGELIIFIVVSIITLNVGIVVGYLRGLGIKVKLRNFKKPQE